ncbi:hypothetical protein OAN83_01930 [Alphaproteobacteria bacterium]|nr:hypothetical protein [Alphaproteobacteria bacterium]
MKIFLCDLYHDYRPNHICVPLGVGFIGAFLEQEFPNFLTAELFKSPSDLSQILGEEGPPDVVGFSNYSWNVSLNQMYKEKIKKLAPQTIIIEGGPHIRIDRDGITSYLSANPLVDFYVMLEGEFATRNLVQAIVDHGGIDGIKKGRHLIDGVAYLVDGELIYSQLLSVKGDLDKIPSPYLTGKLDKFLSNNLYLPLIETNRGCPFACTFCAWGISVLNKVRKFSTERVLSEIEYVAQRSQAVMWYFTDANFGMFERDIEIAYSIRRAVESSDYFSSLSVNWAKNSSKYCTKIASILVGISEPLIAVQSTDPVVLGSIKRSNIKMNTMTDMVAQAHIDGVPMTTDVLAGLPLETYSSHLETLRNVFDMGFQFFNVGLIRMLPGSEMETEASRKMYGLKTKFRQIAGFMGVYDDIPVCEVEESIIETSTISFEEILEIRFIHFISWALWNSGLAQPLLRYVHNKHKINPLDSMLRVVESEDPELRKFLNDYKKEVSEEWFESEQAVHQSYEKSIVNGQFNEYLKINLKYLAQLLLNKPLAERIINEVAETVDDPINLRFRDFCLDRMIFIDEISAFKPISYPPDFIKELRKVYPSITGEDHDYHFSLDKKKFELITFEINSAEFQKDLERGLTLMLQRYGTKLRYEFSLDQKRKDLSEQEYYDSFDYAEQLSTHANAV